jgi:hypothetical protein
MASRLRLTLALSAVVLMGCGGAPADVRAKVTLFQQRVSAGEFEAIRDEWRKAHKTPLGFGSDMAASATLGQRLRTTEAWWQSVTAYAPLVIVYNNTEFERGHALETFSFRVDGAEPQLEGYAFQPGMRMWCPMIALWPNSCSQERDVPRTMTSR